MENDPGTTKTSVACASSDADVERVQLLGGRPAMDLGDGGDRGSSVKGSRGCDEVLLAKSALGGVKDRIIVDRSIREDSGQGGPVRGVGVLWVVDDDPVRRLDRRQQRSRVPEPRFDLHGTVASHVFLQMAER